MLDTFIKSYDGSAGIWASELATVETVSRRSGNKKMPVLHVVQGTRKNQQPDPFILGTFTKLPEAKEFVDVIIQQINGE